jgi:hypothetical protein
MAQEFRFAGQPQEVIADHLIRSLRRLAAGPEAEEHAGDDRTIGLEFDAVLAAKVKMAAAQHLLEEPEEPFHLPAVLVDQTDDLGRHVQQVGGDPQDAVAACTGGTTTILAAAGVRRTGDAHQADRMIGLGFLFAVGERHQLVAQDTCRAIGVRQRSRFQNLGRTVIPHAANLAAVHRVDFVEQRELGIATIHHVQTVGFLPF